MDTLSRLLLLKPGTRMFVVGATGSGKSTFSIYVIHQSLLKWPRYRLVILDPKRRYFPNGSKALFPDGIKARLVGKRIGVPTGGIVVKGNPGFRSRNHRIWVAQGVGDILQLCNWLYDHADARKPTLVFADETYDLMAGSTAAFPLERLMKEGRELNVSSLTISQRPRRISRSMLTESELLAVGHLRHKDDMKYLRDNVNEDIRAVAPRHWELVDQETGDIAHNIRLNIT